MRKRRDEPKPTQVSLDPREISGLVRDECTAFAVNDDVAGVEPSKGPRNYLPVVAVNKDGVVGVMWYHTANPQGDPGWDVRFAASFDGGDT